MNVNPKSNTIEEKRGERREGFPSQASSVRVTESEASERKKLLCFHWIPFYQLCLCNNLVFSAASVSSSSVTNKKDKEEQQQFLSFTSDHHSNQSIIMDMLPKSLQLDWAADDGEIVEICRRIWPISTSSSTSFLKRQPFPEVNLSARLTPGAERHSERQAVPSFDSTGILQLPPVTSPASWPVNASLSCFNEDLPLTSGAVTKNFFASSKYEGNNRASPPSSTASNAFPSSQRLPVQSTSYNGFLTPVTSMHASSSMNGFEGGRRSFMPSSVFNNRYGYQPTAPSMFPLSVDLKENQERVKYLNSYQARPLLGSSQKHSPSNQRLNELFFEVDRCTAQYKQMERERKRVEIDLSQMFPGKKITSNNNIPVTKPGEGIGVKGNKLDKLYLDLMREYTRIDTLMSTMEKLSKDMSPSTQLCLQSWLTSIRDLDMIYKDQLLSFSVMAASQDPLEVMTEESLKALSLAVKELCSQTRAARTAFWFSYVSVVHQELQKQQQHPAQVCPSFSSSASSSSSLFSFDPWEKKGNQDSRQAPPVKVTPVGQPVIPVSLFPRRET